MRRWMWMAGMVVGAGVVVAAAGAQTAGGGAGDSAAIRQPVSQPTPQSTPQPPPSGRGSEKPWDTEVDAGQQIAAALKRARKNNTRVLLEWGGNTYPKSLAFHKQLTSDDKLRKVLLYEYEHVLIDYGQPMGKNVPLSKTYEADVNGGGIPYLTVLDAQGRMFANQPVALLETSSGGEISYDAGAVLKFLEANKATPVPAATVLEKGLAAAKRDGKRAFVHFGAPWCVWCHRLEHWLARPDVAAIMGKDFVEVKIDTERNPGGQAMLDRYAGGEKKSGGIPWFVVLDAEGKPIADSFAKPGADNVGFPAAEEEIGHFARLLEKSAKTMTTDDREKLLATLREQPKEGGK